MRVSLNVKGGARAKRYLEAMRQAVGTATGMRVGFLENATYPAQPGRRGTLHVAQVAFFNEFGTSRAPARPFFRGMIRRDLGDWGSRFARHLRDSNFQSDRAFGLMGTEVRDALTGSIVRWPADNAPSTVARKGFNKGLVDKGIMQRATDFEVLK